MTDDPSIGTAPAEPKAMPQSGGQGGAGTPTGPTGRARFWLVVLAVVAAAGLGSVWAWHYFSSEDPPPAEDPLMPVRQALKLGRLDDAGRLLQSWQVNNPQSHEADLLWAQLARRTGALDAAVKKLEDYGRLAGDSPDLNLERSLIMVQLGQVTGEQKYLEQVMAKEPEKKPLILEALANYYLSTVRPADARVCMSQLLEQVPNHVQGLLVRSRAWKALSEAQEELEDIRRAVELAPDLWEARLGLADVLDRLERPRAALKEYEELKKRRPGDRQVLLGWARCQAALGRRGPARSALAEALPPDTAARLDTGWLMAISGWPGPEWSTSAALGGLVRHGRRFWPAPWAPDALDSQICREIGQLALEDKDPAQAWLWLYRAVELTPFDRRTNHLLLQCSKALRRPSDATAYERRVAEIQKDLKLQQKFTIEAADAPEDPEPRYELGKLLRRHQQPHTALKWFRQALNVDPRHRPTHRALVEYYEEIGRRDLADRHRQAAEK